MAAGTFAVAVSCIDGRVHEPLLAWVRAHSGADHVDLVTEPGPDAALADCPTGACDAIRARLSVSLRAHAPNAVVIAGHDDCAANPVDPATHRLHIAAAVHEVRSWDPAIPVTGVWVGADGTVEEVAADPDGAAGTVRGGV
jgi:hypothetical protein